LFAEMVPTCAISFLPVVGTEIFLSSSTMAATAFSMPRERHRVGASRDVLEAFAEDGLGEDRGGRRAVAGEIRRLGRDFLHHLRAHVFDRISELDFLRDGDAVLGHGRGAELLVDDDVAALRTEGDLHRFGKLIDAALQRRASFRVEMQFLGSHGCSVR